jgi:hypothetical protein
MDGVRNSKPVSFLAAAYSADIDLKAAEVLRGWFGYTSLAEFKTLTNAFYTVNKLSGQVSITAEESRILKEANDYLEGAHQQLAAEMAEHRRQRTNTELPFHYLRGVLQITQYGAAANAYADYLGLEAPPRPLIDTMYGYSEKATQIGLMLKTAGLNADTNRDGEYSIAESLTMLEKHREEMRKKEDSKGGGSVVVS